MFGLGAGGDNLQLPLRSKSKMNHGAVRIDLDDRWLLQHVTGDKLLLQGPLQLVQEVCHLGLFAMLAPGSKLHHPATAPDERPPVTAPALLSYFMNRAGCLARPASDRVVEPQRARWWPVRAVATTVLVEGHLARSSCARRICVVRLKATYPHWIWAAVRVPQGLGDLRRAAEPHPRSLTSWREWPPRKPTRSPWCPRRGSWLRRAGR